ncbi:MAG: helix-turn-helix transcriptional regulator [Thermomicrobiales bacterium]
MKTIEQMRKSAGMTQMQLAVAVGVSLATVYNWEARKTEPKASQLRKVATLFGVSMDDIDFEPRDKVAAG